MVLFGVLLRRSFMYSFQYVRVAMHYGSNCTAQAHACWIAFGLVPPSPPPRCSSICASFHFRCDVAYEYATLRSTEDGRAFKDGRFEDNSNSNLGFSLFSPGRDRGGWGRLHSNIRHGTSYSNDYSRGGYLTTEYNVDSCTE